MAASDSRLLYRVFGGCLLGLAALCLLAFAASTYARHNGGHDLSPLLYVSPLCAALGIGLVALRKIAALIFAVGLCALGLSMIIGSILHVPFPWFVLNIIFSIIMLLPAWLTVRGWGVLTKWI